jgi:hypothetical protein
VLQVNDSKVQYIEGGMKPDPKYDKKGDPGHYFRNIDDTYIFDPTAGIYKPKTIETDQQRARKEAGTNKHARFFTNPKTDWRPIVIATLVSIATVGLLVATVHYARLQWIEMTKAVIAADKSATAATSAAGTAKEVSDNATKSFHISERPYVTVQGIEFDTPLEANKDIGVSVICDNSGRSPALKVGYITSAFIDDKRIGEPIAHEGATVIASAHPTKKHFIMNFSAPDVVHMKVSGDAFKLQGEIKYTDIFGEWHPTTWCSVYDGKQNVFKFCPTGNDVR